MTFQRKPKRPKALWMTMRGGVKPNGLSVSDAREEKTRRLEAERRAVQRKRIPQVSKVQRKKNTAYSVVVKKFKLENPFCACCPKRKMVPRPTEHNHHQRGKLGPLLTDVRFFIPVCFNCHAWIGDHPVEARAIGMLCEEGEWNVPVPPDA